MSQKGEPRRSRRGLIILLVFIAGIAGLVGGAIGGAAGAVWVVETMAKPRYSPKVKNAVVQYDMPAEGARPVDIAGIRKVGTPLNPCLVSFLEDNRDILPYAKWTEVRLSPYFKIDGDIITEMAFARGAVAITRGNEITVRIPDANENRNSVDERLMFHELSHVDQYASGRLDLPDYAASAANAYASGRDAHDNSYEFEADDHAKELLDRWWKSPQRKQCHPDADIGENPDKSAKNKASDKTARAPSRSKGEKPFVQYAIFDHETQEYRLVEHQLHEPKGQR